MDDTFKLHSRPSATKTIYLDFDGFTARGTPWNAGRGRDPIISPAYDLDGNGAAFTDRELQAIQTIWQQVTADYSSFDVNVTTEDPGEAALVNTGGNDDRWGIRVVMTPDDFPGPGSGGVAYIGSFRWGYNQAGATDTPCYVFNSVPEQATLAVSHEVGHSLGLSHDGTNAQNPFQQNAEYYGGHGGAGETSWGPIMGAPYDRNITSWDNGFYLGSNNGGSNANYNSGPDDIAVIISPANGFGMIQDEHGNDDTSATELTGPIDASDRVILSRFGLIERSNDLDYFQFQAGSGTLDLSIDPYITQAWTKGADGTFVSTIESALFNTNYWPATQSTNLDVEAKLYDASGTLIATSNPNGMRAGFSGLQISAGIYYLSVDGVGFGSPTNNPPDGYSDYGSIGQYLITGSMPVAFGVAVSNASLSYIENEPAKAIANWAKVIDLAPGDYSSGSLVVEMKPNPGATDILTFDYSLADGLSEVDSVLLYNDNQIGSITRVSDTSLVINFTAFATKSSIEAIVQCIRFEARGESPDTFNRRIEIALTKGSFRGTTVVQVRVQSVNDSPQATTSFMDDVQEDERSPKGTPVSQIIERGVIDPDATQGSGIIVTSAGSSNGLWQFEAGLGWTDLNNLSTSAGLVLGPTARLRFIPAPNYFGPAPDLKYYALDPLYQGGFSGPSGLVIVDIQAVVAPDSISKSSGEIKQVILPVNDAPFSIPPFPSTTGLQDTPLQYAIPTGLFKDIDDTALTLSAYTAPGVPLPAWLRFNPVTGTFTGTPGNLDVGERQVFVRATDASGAFSDAPVKIDILNVNDSPTNIDLVGQPIAENQRGARLGRLTAVDPDPNDSIAWTTSDPRFVIQGDVLFLAPLASFDFEAASTVAIQVRATDNGSPSLFFEKVISIKVADVNEFSPALEPISMSIAENNSSGAIVGRVLASDADTANRVRYRFFGEAPSQFLLNSETGILAVKPGVTLDHETALSYRFFVEAFDDGTPSLSTWVSAEVLVSDINEFAPVITTGVLTTAESVPVGVPFGRIVATDADRQPSDRPAIVYSLLASESRFQINPSSGELSVARTGVLDFERSRTESLVVIASDTGLPSLSSQRLVSIQVLNANEPPTSITVEKSLVPTNITGLDLGRILVEDPDGPTTYTFTSLDTRFDVVAGKLIMKPQEYLKDSDPIFIGVPLLINDVSGGLFLRMSVGLQRVPNRAPWQNTMLPWDVDRSGSVSPLDVLTLIDAINANPIGNLPMPRSGDSLELPDVDVDGDGRITPLDVLAVINRLNGTSLLGQGEGQGIESLSADLFFAEIGSESDPLRLRNRRR
ncbi:MAG: cadherin domain-containing protein [Planctomycetota bacterium]|nr:cadherin domain-containing protein [Planctomycetota bacterium]